MRLRLASGALFAALCLLTHSAAAAGLGNGKLQIHFMSVGQGDGALLVSPAGEAVLFDNGVRSNCDAPLSYLDGLGLEQVDYHVASHFHDDHIGCTEQVLEAFPLRKTAFDRGGTYASETFKKYLAAVGAKRQTAKKNGTLTLDAGTSTPVTIKFVALNGNGIQTENENDRSLVALVTFGKFKAELGGDLSGEKSGHYEDIESSVASLVGKLDLHKVHHHCSRYSTNTTWIKTTKPAVGIISAGDANKHGHPAPECVEILHDHAVKLYWTAAGNGADPSPDDVIGKNIIVQVAPAATTYTVTHSGSLTDTYTIGGGPAPAPAPPAAQYAWSKKSSKYHHADCSYVENILPENLERGTAPPAGKTLHAGCPTSSSE